MRSDHSQLEFGYSFYKPESNVSNMFRCASYVLFLMILGGIMGMSILAPLF